MYAHEVVNDIEKIIKKGYMQDDRYLENIKILLESIRTSQKFHLGNVANFSNIISSMVGELFMGNNGIHIKCPYPEMWFDYTVDYGAEIEMRNKKEGIQSSKRGIYACEILPDAILCQTVPYLNSEKKWIPSFVMHLYLINDTFRDRPDVVKFIESYWLGKLTEPMMDLNYYFIASSDNVNNMYNSGEKGKDAIFGFIEEDKMEITVLNMALKLLCCKNIISEGIVPTKIITKKKKKKTVPNKRKFVYKILNLVLPKTRKKREVNETNETTVRVHFCRGHFKTYTEDSPLFGKIIGTFWWQSYVRGNPSDGAVFKSYEIAPAV